jgi:putative nucleotidyltransferase with HDIG domain
MTHLQLVNSAWRPDTRLSSVLAALSYGLDLTEGQRPGHAVRSCHIGMRVAHTLGLDVDQQSHLFYALLMKDLGCSSDAERGADIARMLGFPDETVQAIRALDEHWNGAGQPYSLEREQIPLLARILGLAQTAEVDFTSYGVDAAFDMARTRRGTWFDPAVVDALLALRHDTEFWSSLGSESALGTLSSLEPRDRRLVASDDHVDRIAEAFALVIDAKSPWTFQHSRGVADVSVAIARTIGYSEEQLRDIRRAALLHDIGKLGVSSLILDKPGPLTDEESAVMCRHPAATREILKRTGCFTHLAHVAASHHERLDGGGYDLGLAKSELPLMSRILCVADIFDALRASRPYRRGLPTERVLAILNAQVGTGIDPICFEALETVMRQDEIARSIDVPAAQYVSSLSEDYHQAA